MEIVSQSISHLHHIYISLLTLSNNENDYLTLLLQEKGPYHVTL